MSSGFPGGYSDFFTAGGTNINNNDNHNNNNVVRSSLSSLMSSLHNNNNNYNNNNSQNLAQPSYRSPLSGIIPDNSPQIALRRPDFLTGKRSLAEFQFQQQQLQQQAMYLRNVKPRLYQQTSPISPLPEFATEVTYGVPIHQQQFRPKSFNNLGNGSVNAVMNSLHQNNFGPVVNQEENKMMDRLQELEKQLLDDNEDENGNAASVVTNSEWSETIQNLISPSQAQKPPISPSPTSSSSSCSSSPATVCPKQSMAEAATAIADGKPEAAVEIITRLNHVSNVKGTPEQRLTAYMSSALKSRLNSTEFQAAELYTKEHVASVHMLYEKSPCFKLGFMAANLAILDAVVDQPEGMKIHVLDFDVANGGQYVHLLHEIAARGGHAPKHLRITAFEDFANGSGERLKVLAEKLGVKFTFSVINLKICDLNVEALGIETDETFVVNLAFNLYKLPDESVTTENIRDELLRRVKNLSPAIVTVVEQEMNANTSPFVARVTEACSYYGALLESLVATLPRECSEREMIEEGVGRKMKNSVACEGRDRVERCEVFGKWRARMCMAGFKPKPLSQLVVDSVRSKLGSLSTRGGVGFTANEQAGGVGFGWMGRTLTVASAWI